MFYQANINNPEFINLSNQAHDIRNYMREMEIQGDLWDQKDLEYYMYIESLLEEIEVELHIMHVNEIF